uniref:plasmid recombination protein n=1 Tax=Burkholderia multivorans TaxID=87883 RepID=UPI0021BE4B53
MSFAIARVGKLNSWGKVGAAGGHNLRTRPTPNANADRTPDNVVLHGPDDLAAAVRDRLDAAGVTPGRKDAVLAAEFVLTASPEFFEGKTPEQVRAWAD